MLARCIAAVCSPTRTKWHSKAIHYLQMRDCLIANSKYTSYLSLHFSTGLPNSVSKSLSLRTDIHLWSSLEVRNCSVLLCWV